MPVFVASGYALMLKLRHSWRRRGSNSVRNGAICRHGRNLLVVSSVCRSSLLAAGGARGGPKKTDFDRAQKARGAPPRTLERPGQPPQEERLAFGAMRSWFFAAFVSNWPGSKRYFGDAFRWGSYSRRWPKLRRLPGVRRRIPGQLARRFLALCKKSAATCRLSCVESAPPRQSSLVAICEARRRESAPSCRFSHREPKKGIGPCRHVEKRSDASH